MRKNWQGILVGFIVLVTVILIHECRRDSRNTTDTGEPKEKKWVVQELQVQKGDIPRLVIAIVEETTKEQEYRIFRQGMGAIIKIDELGQNMAVLYLPDKQWLPENKVRCTGRTGVLRQSFLEVGALLLTISADQCSYLRL